jgi:predicted ArsR family transcriptional regulator
MAGSERDALSDAKRRLVERLKRMESATAVELADAFGLTDTAIRQHLDALEAVGLVARTVGPPAGRGRPPVHWRLTSLAGELFPDRHGELTVELIESIREAFGDDGVDAVVCARTARQRRAYADALGRSRPEANAGRSAPGEPESPDPIELRVRRLADLRTAEGYLAEVTRQGDALILTEHHCPICEAAAVCQGLCQGELELFRDTLGTHVTVERTTHLLSGGTRCSYRIEERSPEVRER